MKTDTQMNAEQAARIRSRMEECNDTHIRNLHHSLTDAQLLRLQFLVAEKRMEIGEIVGR